MLWLQAHTKKVILRTEKPCGRDRGCGQWERSSCLLAKAALTSPRAASQAGEVGLSQASSLGPRGETERRRKFTLGRRGTRDVGGVEGPEPYNLRGCCCCCFGVGVGLQNTM